MRRFLAMILAVLLVAMPVATLAESYVKTITFEADADAYAEGLKAAAAAAEQMYDVSMGEVLAMLEEYQLADMFDAIYGALSIQYEWQDDGLRLAFNMQDKLVLDAYLSWNAEEIAFQSNILPDTKLVLPMDEVEEKAAQLAAVDWTALLDSLGNRVIGWTESLRGSAGEGNYAGDAYQGGTRIVTYDVTDADIADLLESLMLGLESSESLMVLLNDLFGESGVTNTFRRFRERILEASMDSEYHYVLNIVSTDAMVIGLSLNVMEAEELIATVSFGEGGVSYSDVIKSPNEMLVAAIPVGEGIIYVEALFDASVEAREYLYSVYQSDKLISYQQAAQDAELLVQRMHTSYKNEPKADGFVRTLDMVLTSPIYERALMVTNVTNSPYSEIMRCDMWMTENGNPMMTFHSVTTERQESIQFPAAAKIFDMTAMGVNEEAELQGVLEEGAQIVAVNVFQALPPELFKLVLQMQ